MNRIEFACLCNDQANMKVSEKPTGMNHRTWLGCKHTRDQHPRVWSFLSWRFGRENISLNYIKIGVRVSTLHRRVSMMVFLSYYYNY